MLVDKTDMTIESTLTGDAIPMTIDADSVPYIMDFLTDIYEDEEAAIVREISTNAYDSHIEAGIFDPIEVTLPTRFVPELVIKDHGIGLSHDDIINIYSKYGASTKRDSNEQTGMLGLGCKAPLTYTDQFTLIGIKDGVEVHVVVSRNQAGAGEMNVISETSTDEPNGVTVKVPVKKYNDIPSKAADFFKHWQPGTVLVDGEEHQRLEGKRITDTITLVEDEYISYVVQGNVAYPIEIEHGLERGALVVHVPIGTVNFLPSREALRLTAKTKGALDNIAKEFHAEFPKVIQATIDAADTAHEAMKIANGWRYQFKDTHQENIKLAYRGTEIPWLVKAPDKPTYELDDKTPEDERDDRDRRLVVSSNSYDRLSVHSKEREVTASVLADGFVVTDYSLKFTANHKKKLKKYCNEKGISVKHFVLCAELPSGVNEWLDPERIVNWEIIKAVPLDANRGVRPDRVKLSYEAVQNSVSLVDVTADHLDELPYFFYAQNKSRMAEYKALNLLNSYYPNVVVVLLPTNRIDKFARDFPESRPVEKVLREEYNKIKALVTDIDLLAKVVKQRNYAETITKLETATIKDPKINKVIELWNHTLSPQVDALYQFDNLLYYLGVARRDEVKFEDPFDDYPLFDNFQFSRQNGQHTDHVIAYLNGAYPLVKKARSARRKKGKKN